MKFVYYKEYNYLLLYNIFITDIILHTYLGCALQRPFQLVCFYLEIILKFLVYVEIESAKEYFTAEKQQNSRKKCLKCLTKKIYIFFKKWFD